MALDLSNSQYDRIMAMYQQRRFDAEARYKNHRSYAYEHIPKLRELDKELIDATYTKKGEALKSIVSDIEKKREDALKKAGYPKDYLKIKYLCPECNDTGFIGENKCSCFKNTVISMLYSDKSWTTLFKNENFDSFRFDYYESKESLEAAKDAYNKAKDFALSILQDNENINNLIITGNTGIGKTFLCNCIAKELVENEKLVVYLSAPALVELFEKNAFGAKKSPDEISPEVRDLHYSSIFQCDLLIIDDLGTEYTNSFTNSKLLELINKRLVKGSTLISTNLDMQGLRDLYSERFLSRIIGNYKFIRLLGEDIRLKKRCSIPDGK